MGGAKKKPISQMDTGLTGGEQEQKKPKAKATPEKRVRGVSLPKFEGETFLKELSKMGAITPYALAAKYDLRLSVAKNVLKELERRNIIRFEDGNRRIKIFRFVGA
ncbi:MAG: 30S ribosomal protein S25e [Candidatus Bathyarchaeia archaeon]